MSQITPLLMILVVAASAALAHSGVKDPHVKARMDAMGALGAQTKVLSQMAKGAAPFDAEQALTAIENIQAEAKRTPAFLNRKQVTRNPKPNPRSGPTGLRSPRGPMRFPMR